MVIIKGKTTFKTPEDYVNFKLRHLIHDLKYLKNKGIKKDDIDFIDSFENDLKEIKKYLKDENFNNTP